MANWSNPLITTQYDVFVNEAKDRDVDCAQMFLNPPTNQPIGTIRYNRITNTFQEWIAGSVWQDKIIGVAGGGTGASTSGGAVAGLGLGTMSTQNSNAVNITGGNITNLSGFSLGTSITFTADATFDIGTNAVRPRKAYIRDALVVPVGVDKFATS